MANATLFLASFLAAPASTPPRPASTEAAAPAPAAPQAPAPEDVPVAAEMPVEPTTPDTDVEPEPSADAKPEAEPVTDGAPEYTDVPFNIGLFPSASINGAHEGEHIRNNVSIGVLWAKAARVEGLTIAGGVTVVTESMEGVAAGQFGNINRGEMMGVAASLFFNTAETLEGVQASHGYNWAREVKGAQFGMVNAAGTARGAQFGLINAAGTVRGAQFGLINVADEADASLALIPVTREGGFHPEVFTSDTAMVNLGFRLPAKYTYMFASVGLQPLGRLKDGRLSTADGEGRAWEAGLGWGGHIPLSERVSMDIDFGGFVVTDSLAWSGPVGNMSRLRMLVNYSFVERLTVWGGPTVVALVDQPSGGIDRPGYAWVAGDYSSEREDVRVRLWPGFAAGVRF